MLQKSLFFRASTTLVLVGLMFNTGTADTPGSLDEAFNPGANGEVLFLRLFEQDRIVASGIFSTISGNDSAGVGRLDLDGTFDETFDVGTGASNNLMVDTVVLDGEQRFLAAGDFTTFKGSSRNRVVRFSEDGTLDEEFVPSSEFSNRVRAIVPLDDGGIVIAGDFFNVGEHNLIGVAGLNADGSLDSDFNAGGSGTNLNSIYTLARIEVEGDNGPETRILVGGEFSSYNGQSRSRIAVINPDGSLAGNDDAFSVGSGFNGTVRTFYVAPDGKIYAGGNFTTYRGNLPGARIVRMHPNGERDDTFSPAAPNGLVRAIREDSEGRVIIAGDFTMVDGQPRNRIARLRSDGQLDHSFDPGEGANSRINALAIQEDGSILIGGNFSQYDGQSRNRIARVFGGDAFGDPDSEYEAWRQEMFGADAGNDAISGPQADPDGDGVANLLEYAFDGDPLTPSTAVLPEQAVAEEGGDAFLEITFHRINAGDLVYRVQVTEDLNDAESWEDIWVSTDHPFSGNSETVRDTVPIGTNASRFLRVLVGLE